MPVSAVRSVAGIDCQKAQGKQTFRARRGHANLIPMNGIELIETEWGSELHLELIALEMRARVEWRNSPEAGEEMRRLEVAAGREMAPLEVAAVHDESLNLPVYIWA